MNLKRILDKVVELRLKF